MPYTSRHHYLDKKTKVSLTTQNGNTTASFSASGKMDIRFPGKLLTTLYAAYDVSILIDLPAAHAGEGPSGTPKWHAQRRTLPLTLEIKTPDGQLFTGARITLEDLRRFRDPRGVSQGHWTYKVSGKSDPIFLLEGKTRVIAGNVRLYIGVDETIASKSAPPLVKTSVSVAAVQRFTFDLYRTGSFIAKTKYIVPDIFGSPAYRPMRLLDPDGNLVATGTGGKLSYTVSLRTLDKSRGADGAIRLWTLELQPFTDPNKSKPVTVWASVMATSTITASALQSRIDALIGVNGNKLSIYGENKGDDLCCRLKILDEVSAETIDMHGLLDDILEKETQDQAGTNITAGVAYTIASKDRTFSVAKASLDAAKIESISISIGASEKLAPSIPALKIDIRTKGSISLKLAGFNIATAKIRNNRIQMELGLKIDANGTFAPETWMTPDLLDIDASLGVAVLAGLVTAGIATAVAIAAAEYFENEFNRDIPAGIRSMANGIMSKIPHILAVINGDDFTYEALRLDGNNIVFEYVAPLEPEPKPTKGYSGVVGRAATQLAPDTWQIIPRNLDTWKADNLSKIDHVVVVMMENRSFDHVLGYRAQLPGLVDSCDGLSSQLVEFLRTEGFDVDKLNQSGIQANSRGLKTKFPSSVGHELEDVIQQLSEKLTLPNGKVINSPKGFVDNFTPNLAGHPELKDKDVLGYYDANDLPFYKYLADNYAYCEKFFCSHGGPTLPNRMYSLTGDLQYDRVGEAILNNNNQDNFYLSRATTIFDLLTRKGVPWRVYESFPSVTMLRMFARYATDETRIRNIDRFAADVLAGNLPAVTIVDPAMHHFPENDDHSPDADMYSGQLFLKSVYDTLRSNETLWRKTMLVITYDEHGGFYDHVVPPLADIRQKATPPILEAGFLGAAGGVPANAVTNKQVLTNYGVRVPTFVVSPWVPAGKGPDIVLDFCSILKTILARFCAADKPFLSDRVAASGSFNDYLSATTPRMNVPAPQNMLPLTLAAPVGQRKIKTELLSRARIRTGDVDYHDLTGMLARMLGR